ncbi:PilZ domain-containing protein [Halopseudomonas pelagia]|uniref:PilZ domain-containing protein n=1 Tax=Halopseudomonas pelagia TaxID=553151 RepID=UPI00048EB60D|nr:PilZ domain-containing protein [Halopseudomonas pelagia]|tara:strand:+ start:20723 stop:21313 length:591 start_codon:yes stop_codon:yes gene_type:complete
MHTDDGETDEKRDFFRIRDQMALQVKPIDGPELNKETQDDESPLFSLLSDLHMLDYESQHLLRQIAERDRALAHYLKIINKRVDLVGKALAMQLTGDLSEPQEVTLSEGGMAFSSPQAYALDSWLMLRMVLMPSLLGLVLPARVIRCEAEQDTGQWQLGVSFDNLSDAQRQLLARHILQKQAQEIRAAKTTEGMPT